MSELKPCPFCGGSCREPTADGWVAVKEMDMRAMRQPFSGCPSLRQYDTMSAAGSPVPYIVDLARKNSEALSYIPAPRLEHYAAENQVLLERQNGEPCGFLVHGNGRVWCRVYQACIQYDARRVKHGLRLVARLVNKATAQGFEGISLWCADDLEANTFWRQAGFQFAGQRAGGQRRGRLHNRWVLYLDSPQMSLLSPRQMAAATLRCASGAPAGSGDRSPANR